MDGALSIGPIPQGLGWCCGPSRDIVLIMDPCAIRTSPGALFGVRAALLLAGLLALSLMLGLPQAKGIDIPFQRLLGEDLGGMGDQQEEEFQPISEPTLEYLRQPHQELDVLIQELIADENWEAWQTFQSTTATVIPVASAQLYIIYSAELSRTKRPKVQVSSHMAKEPKVVRTFRLAEIQTMLGQLQKEYGKRGNVTWKPLSWLFDEEGVFSGREWTLDNFMPRLLTIAGVVVGLLVFVEFLHLLAALGMRTLRGRGNRQIR